jgi:uncharacterized membrane protein
MAYCCQCGQPVRDTDRYCGRCGAPQPLSAAPGAADPFSSISSRNASLLCYIPFVGWIAAIVVLASARFRHDHEVRFNAFQGLYLFVAWLIVDWVLTPFLRIPGDWFVHSFLVHIFKLAIIAIWIFMIVRVSQGQTYRLPILGELADRSVSEQRNQI